MNYESVVNQNDHDSLIAMRETINNNYQKTEILVKSLTDQITSLDRKISNFIDINNDLEKRVHVIELKIQSSDRIADVIKKEHEEISIKNSRKTRIYIAILTVILAAVNVISYILLSLQKRG